MVFKCFPDRSSKSLGTEPLRKRFYPRIISVCVLVQLASNLIAIGQTVDFNRDIRPILTENCFTCHGPDQATRVADLRLDQRDNAISTGAIVPGDAEASTLIERIFEEDSAWIMPPVESRKTLSEEQKRMLRRWIDQGATYDVHWAYRPIVKPDVPQPKSAGSANNESAATQDVLQHNVIDAFVVSRVQDAGLSQNPETDRAALMRRLKLDLLGLPPTFQELQAFCNDEDSQAYTHLVDELLASPHFGERMASMWLDVVRYADTVGYHGDQNQNAFAYRDWVINAFNDNLPFDQFTLHQLAGDLLPHPNESTLIATCFNRLNMMTREGGAQPEEYLAKYAADRVRTVGTAWLGSTLGCAECHDHKYDPFSMEDFYSIAAFFADLKQWGVYQDYPYTPNPDLRHWSNDHPFPPELEVSIPYLSTRQQNLIEHRNRLALETWRENLGNEGTHDSARAWLKAMAEYLHQHRDGWQWLEPRASEGEGIALASVEDVAFADPTQDTEKNQETSISALELKKPILTIAAGQPAKIRFEIQPAEIPEATVWSTIRIDWEVLPEFEGWVFPSSTKQASANFHFEQILSDGETRRPLRVHFAESKFKNPRYYNGFEINGVHSGWLVPNQQQSISSVWILDQPIVLGPSEKISVTISGIPARRLAAAVSPFVPLYGEGRTIELVHQLHDISNTTEADPLSSVHLECLETAEQLPCEDWFAVQWCLTQGAEIATDGRRKMRELELEILQCRGGRWPVMISVSQEPRETRVLPRGNWQDLSGKIVTPKTPHFLPSLALNDSERLSRIDLANWLVSRDNPLTARVQVNRLWKHFFGAGLSGVLDDFGFQGEYPAHPELLDWLAAEFIDSGWNIKHIIRMIVLSGTYRQSSRPSDAARALDPANRLLSHQNARRLEAEVLRDQALTISGLINLDMGGPPIFPYQPDNYYSHLQFPDRRYVADRNDRQYRRGVYMHWQRTFLHPMLANFDAPAREECVGMRLEANTPQQALTLLNDPTFVEAAVAFAKLIVQLQAPDENRISYAFERALCRSPQQTEIDSLRQFIDTQREHWRQNENAAKVLMSTGLQRLEAGDDPIELASWTSLARVILNLHETITRH